MKEMISANWTVKKRAIQLNNILIEEFKKLPIQEKERVLKDDTSSSEEENLDYDCPKGHLMNHRNSTPPNYSSLETFCSRCGIYIIV